MKHNKIFLAFLTEKRIARFWGKVDKAAPNECWNWLGFRDRYGYGNLKIAPGIRVTASRLAFALANGLEPGTNLVCHRCDNPSCCNPSHLYLGTSKENMQDKVRRGRARGRFSTKVQIDTPRPVLIVDQINVKTT